MLHRIEPVCSNEFAWVGTLQSGLLEAVLSPTVESDMVTLDWAVLQVTDLTVDETWLRGFLQKKDKIRNWGLNVLVNLQMLAGASAEDKTILLEVFQTNRGFERLYDDTGCRLRKYAEIDNQDLCKAYRAFLSVFYDPVFYPTNSGNGGYPVYGDQEYFTRSQFVKSFETVNELSVCVLCDFDLNDPDVDHFLSKKEFPELSCHQANLVPICRSCNGRARKGEKAPLDFDAEDQCADWFHPYCRSVDWQDVVIRFDSNKDGVHIKLHSNEASVEARLNKLNYLVDLEERWSDKLPHIARTTIKQLKSLRRKAGRFDLREKLNDWAESKKCEVGELSIAMLYTAYLEQAAAGEPILLEELEKELSEGSL